MTSNDFHKKVRAIFRKVSQLQVAYDAQIKISGDHTPFQESAFTRGELSSALLFAKTFTNILDSGEHAGRFAHQVLNDFADKLITLNNRLGLMKNALEFYADQKNYHWNDRAKAEGREAVLLDCGDVAVAALNNII